MFATKRTNTSKVDPSREGCMAEWDGSSPDWAVPLFFKHLLDFPPSGLLHPPFLSLNSLNSSDSFLNTLISSFCLCLFHLFTFLLYLYLSHSLSVLVDHIPFSQQHHTRDTSAWSVCHSTSPTSNPETHFQSFGNSFELHRTTDWTP